jgi:hypothetical protein
MIDVLEGYVIGRTVVGVIDGNCSVIALNEIMIVVGLHRSVRHQACPALPRMSIRGEFRHVQARLLTDIIM